MELDNDQVVPANTTRRRSWTLTVNVPPLSANVATSTWVAAGIVDGVAVERGGPEDVVVDPAEPVVELPHPTRAMLAATSTPTSIDRPGLIDADLVTLPFDANLTERIPPPSPS